LLAEGQLAPQNTQAFYGPHEVEIREFTDEPVSVVETTREVQVEKQLTTEEQDALRMGMAILTVARAQKNINDAYRALAKAQEEGLRAIGNSSEALSAMLNNAGMPDLISEMKENMGIYDEDEPAAGTECPNCGEQEYLNPETGLCYDCNEGEDEEEDDEDEEQECVACGDLFAPIDLNVNGVCEDCVEDEEGSDEEEEF
jgi:predicted RNA-binding Zn-ribbon protein involved in translation (DUF1610 family)